MIKIYNKAQRAPVLRIFLLFSTACVGLDKGDSLGGQASSLEVCERWNLAQEHLSEGTWSGSTSNCDAGTVSAEGMENALRQVNLHRWLAGLSEVETSEEKNQAAQECALITDANFFLTHFPEPNAQCYSELGAEGASRSNIAGVPGVYAVHGYMIDPGNETTLGHRRWILANSLGPIGLGSTSDYSCMHVVGGSGTDDREWTAWPPEGVVPIGVFEYPNNDDLNETGWSVQSDTIDLSEALATITRDDGEELPVDVVVLQEGLGSETAISMIPDGWWIGEADSLDYSYHVQISNISADIEYTVEVVDCGEEDSEE